MRGNEIADLFAVAALATEQSDDNPASFATESQLKLQVSSWLRAGGSGVLWDKELQAIVNQVATKGSGLEQKHNQSLTGLAHSDLSLDFFLL